MSKRVLLLHGWGGSDFPHWQSWLAGELAKDYGTVNFLKFSNVETPSLKVWSKELLETLKEFQPDIVICHSLANTLWFHLCNQAKLPTIKHLYLVAPPSLTCNVTELAEFFPVVTPSKLFAKNATLIYSTNDPYMSIQEAQNLQKKLNIKSETIKNGGHLNSSSGYGEWPELLQTIKNLY